MHWKTYLHLLTDHNHIYLLLTIELHLIPITIYKSLGESGAKE